MTRAKLAKPKPRTSLHQIGDVVQTGSTRWIIRIINGEQVELEASNASPGIWWRTTRANLPEKEIRL